MAAQTALAELRSEAHVSVSALTTYIQCPRKYELSYLRNVPPTHRPGALSFGAAVHAALAMFYSSLRPGKTVLSKQALTEAFIKSWQEQLSDPVPTLFDDGETPQKAEDTGVALLEAFYDLAPRPFRVVECETPFSVELIDPDSGMVLPVRLVGVFDAVLQDQTGRFTILEHKISSRRWSEDRLTFDRQLTAYTYAAPAMGMGNADIVVQLLLRQKKPALEIYHPTRTDDDRRDFLRLATGVLRAIEARAFYPNRDWHCRNCPWAGPCWVD